MIDYYKKYLKYKLKYKLLIGGSEIDDLIDIFINKYQDIIFDIYESNNKMLLDDEFPSTHLIINDEIILTKYNIKSIYIKNCHLLGIIFIYYLIIKGKISNNPNIKIHLLNKYPYDKSSIYPVVDEIEEQMKEKDILYHSLHYVYIDSKTNNDPTQFKKIEEENILKALTFIKTINTVSRILININNYYEFIIININNKLYLLKTTETYIEKIELSIEDIVNIFNNNIDEKLDRKINFKIDNFFINAFFGYNINL